jgi:hypothetical protein
MTPGGTISRVLQVVSAFVRRKVIDEGADALPWRGFGSLGGLAPQVLELGEDLFDRVDVGAVGRVCRDRGEIVYTPI